jgi:hypothetical protein
VIEKQGGATVGLSSAFSRPVGVAVDALGNVFVADYYHSLVQQIAFSGGAYAAAAPIGSGFSLPSAVAVDGNGRLYTFDLNAVWKFVP